MDLCYTARTMTMSRQPIAILCGLALLVSAGRSVAEATNPPPVRVLNLDGLSIDPFRTTAARLKVFFFVSTECPIANRYAPEVRRFCEKFGAQGVDFALVYCDADTTPAAIRQHLKEYRYPCAALRDPKQALARLAHIQVTPECAVFNAAGQLLYHGRIDNRYADFGRARPEPTQRDLQDALAAALVGRAPAGTNQPAVGCRLPELP